MGSLCIMICNNMRDKKKRRCPRENSGPHKLRKLVFSRISVQTKF